MPRSRCEVAIFVVSCSGRIRVTPVTTAPPGRQLRPAPDCIVLDVLTSMRFTAAVNRAAVASHRAAVASCRTAVASSAAAVASCRTAVASRGAAVASHRAAVASCRTAVASRGAAVASHRAAVASCRTAVASRGAAVASRGRSNVQRHSRTDDDCLLSTPVIHGR